VEKSDRRSLLPQIERLLSRPEITAFCANLSRPLVVRSVSQALEGLRRKVQEDEYYVPSEADAVAASLVLLERLDRKRIRRILNGTGVVLHTNMGRSPIAKAVWEQAGEANTAYSNLEYDLEDGRRGHRGGMVGELLSLLTGAEGALVVNNNAAAMLLVLSCIAQGKEVIVSRGEAVQIGGGFRVPDILALSGCRLVEVGTTNVTTVEDYLRAISPETGAVLSIHASNFALRGFASKPDARTLKAALPSMLPFIVDQGSGCTDEDVPGEIPVVRYVRAGADLVCFSGDKIAGGPQAGLIVGKDDLIARLARHPLMRALRPGKTVFSLLEAALVLRLGAGSDEGEALPADSSAVQKALRLSLQEGHEDLKAFGRRINRKLPKGSAKLVESSAAIGGGSSPDEFIPSHALELTTTGSPDSLRRALRLARIPLICRIEKDRVLIDLLTLFDEDASLVADLILEAQGMEGSNHAGTTETESGGTESSVVGSGEPDSDGTGL